MLPISLNKQIKSIFGGYYDIFLAEFSKKKISIIIIMKIKQLFYIHYIGKAYMQVQYRCFLYLIYLFWINKRDDYIEANLINYFLKGNEMVFIFIYNNFLQAIRVDYSKEFHIFKRYKDFGELGYYSCYIFKFVYTQHSH